MSDVTEPILACLGCGATKSGPDGSPTDLYPSEHCGQCPPWTCEACGEISDAENLCSCWVSLENMPFADIKALFAGDGTFDIGADGRMTVAEKTEFEL